MPSIVTVCDVVTRREMRRRELGDMEWWTRLVLSVGLPSVVT